MTMARPIRALHRVREYVAAEPNTALARRMQEDGRAFESFEQRVSDTVSTLVNNVAARWGDQKVPLACCSSLSLAYDCRPNLTWYIARLWPP